MSEHVYNLLKNHHSVRKFKKEPISEAHIKQLVEAGQSASTSSYLQAYSIIGINDPEIKEELKEVSGQPYVVENGYLFVFVMDYYRHSIINEESKHDMQTSFESAEGLLVGTIDATLVAQNIAATAEDMGYGMVYLGSLRNDVERVREILELPKHTFPLFGMALGIPEFLKGNMVKEGVTVIDVGITRLNDDSNPKGYRIVGDVAFNEVKEKASYITPVPGGVGSVTTAILARHVVAAAQRTLA